ncbi:unnamed protein product [Amoebophrya sp. A120]|nr:unnamed protein product [Amoebophrya sp. A120]|eukprot:GSA120T00005433001.1
MRRPTEYLGVILGFQLGLTTVSALGPVIQVLEKLQTDLAEEHKEKTSYFEELLQNCKADVDSETAVVESSKNQVDTLKSSLATFQGRIGTEQDALSSLGEDVTSQEAEIGKLKKQKQTRKTEFIAARESLTKTLLALERAAREFNDGKKAEAEKDAGVLDGAAQKSAANAPLGTMIEQMSQSTREKLQKLIQSHKQESEKVQDLERSVEQALLQTQDDMTEKKETVETLQVDAGRATRELAKSKEALKAATASLKDEHVACADHAKEKEFVLNALAAQLENVKVALDSLQKGKAEVEEIKKNKPVEGEKEAKGEQTKAKPAVEKEQKEDAAEAEAADEAEETSEKVDSGAAQEQAEKEKSPTAGEQKSAQDDKTEADAAAQEDEDADQESDPDDASIVEEPAKRQTSFLQQRSQSSTLAATSNNRKLVLSSRQLRLQQASLYLKKVSPQLASLVQANVNFASKDSPFDKVTAMIKQMITKLEQQQAEDQSQDDYCKQSFAKAEAKKKKLEKEVAKFKERMETTESLVEQQNVSAKKTAKDLLLVQEEQKKDAALRTSGKAENEKILAETTAHEKALAGAVAAMEGQSGSSGAAPAPSFLQIGTMMKTVVTRKLSSAATTQTGTTNKGNTANGSVLELLRHLHAEAEDLLRSTAKEEKIAAAQFTELTNKRKVETAVLQKKEEMTELEKQRLKTQLLQQKEDVRLTEDELSAVVEGIANLKDQCTPKTLTPEEKQARRQETLDSLKEALEILEGEE